MKDHVDRAYEAFYETLHEVARRQLRGAPSDTLHPTVLMNEAYLRLRNGAGEFNDTLHARAVAMRAMKQVLLDHARARGRQKRGGGALHVSLSHANGPAGPDTDPGGRVDMGDLATALERLREKDPRKAEVVELLFLGGFTPDEAANSLGVSRRTVERDWKVARVLLLASIEELQAGS